MKRETFIGAIDALEMQHNIDEEFSQNMAKAFPFSNDADLYPNNSLIKNILLEILQEETGDNDLIEQPGFGSCSLIEHYCYNLEFGKDEYNMFIHYKNKYYSPKNAGELYDFMLNRNNQANE